MAQLTYIPIYKSTSSGSGEGEEAKRLDNQIVNILETWSNASISLQTKLHKFCNLAITWKEETKVLPTMKEIALNTAYQEIIGMGKDVVPYILQLIKEKPDLWFWALKAITGVDPIKQSNRGNIKNMTKDWLTWGEENAYI